MSLGATPRRLLLLAFNDALIVAAAGTVLGVAIAYGVVRLVVSFASTQLPRADAIEVNLYSVPTDPEISGDDIEQSYLTILASLKAQLKIPIAVKLSPYFTNFARFAHRLDHEGADALVLFNRFYQPDIELETLEISPNVLLSTPMAMRLPMRWIALLRGRIGANLAATSGIHRATDALKMLMAGADVTMLCSVLLRRGIDHIRVLEKEMRQWMEEHEYESIEQLKGSMSQERCPDPTAFERAQYMRALSTYPRPDRSTGHRPPTELPVVRW